MLILLEVVPEVSEQPIHQQDWQGLFLVSVSMVVCQVCDYISLCFLPFPLGILS